jgi:hypothetical protein
MSIGPSLVPKARVESNDAERWQFQTRQKQSACECKTPRYLHRFNYLYVNPCAQGSRPNKLIVSSECLAQNRHRCYSFQMRRRLGLRLSTASSTRQRQGGRSGKGRAEAVIRRTIACMRYLVPGTRDETAASYLSSKLCLFNPSSLSNASQPASRCCFCHSSVGPLLGW